MALENGLYAQEVIIHRRELDDKKKKDKTKKYNFQGQQAGTKHWFDIDHEWLKENFMTREQDFYKNYIKLNLGVNIFFLKLELQLVLQK